MSQHVPADATFGAFYRQADGYLAIACWTLFATSCAYARFFPDSWHLVWLLALPGAILSTVLWRILGGSRIVRLVNAVLVMGFAALHIQQSHGLTEAHFGVFAFMSFLIIYRDWLVIVVSGVLICLHHVLFNQLQAAGYEVYLFEHTTGFGWVMLHAIYVAGQTIALAWFAILLNREGFQLLSAAVEENKRRHDEGEISALIPIDNMPPGYRRVATQINELVQGHVQVKRQVIQVASAYSRGDFTVTMPQMPGERAQIAEAVNAIGQRLRDVVHTVTDLLQDAKAGQLGKRADAGRFHGDFRRMVELLNDFLESVVIPFRETSNFLKKLADGDLSTTITTNYPGEFGAMVESVLEVANNIKMLLLQMQDAVNNLMVAGSQIERGTLDLSQRTERQAAGLEETTSSINELSNMVVSNAEDSQNTAQKAIDLHREASQGMEQAKGMVASMGAINESSRRIGAISAIIDEVAFQTNLLALNAAVEAARAGEHGRGFAVVAQEVRGLAETTSGHARAIRDLITENQQRFTEGNELVIQTSKRFTQMLAQITEMQELAQRIASATQEQARGIEEIRRAGVDLNNITQQNAALVEENSAAVTAVHDQIEDLKQILDSFTLDRQSSRPAELSLQGQQAQAVLMPPIHDQKSQKSQLAAAQSQQGQRQSDYWAEERISRHSISVGKSNAPLASNPGHSQDSPPLQQSAWEEF